MAISSCSDGVGVRAQASIRYTGLVRKGSIKILSRCAVGSISHSVAFALTRGSLQAFITLALLICLKLSGACLEEIVGLRDVLEGRVQRPSISILVTKTIAGANTVAVSDFAGDGRDDVTLGDYDRLPSHRRRFVSCRAGLHDLLQVGRQVDERSTSSQLGLIRIDFKLDVADSTIGIARILAASI